MGSLIADCLEVLRFKSESKGLKLDYKVSEELLDRYIMTDANRLKQILINLVSNAIKYTQHGSVQIKASLSLEHSMVEIDVIDSGVGIEHDRLEGLFTAFTKIMRYRELN